MQYGVCRGRPWGVCGGGDALFGQVMEFGAPSVLPLYDSIHTFSACS